MKSYIKILIIMLFGVIAHAQQSSIVFDSGTNIDVGIGADISAGTITVNGTYSGGGTFNNGPLPVELTSFTASVLESKVILNWQTATEVNNYGFEIERQILNQVQNDNWEKIGFVAGHGNSNSPKDYSFIDQEKVAERSRSYRLKQIDIDGKYEYSKEIEIDLGMPNEFSLSQNYPNPFNPSTTIKYSIPKIINNQSSIINIKVYDILGNVVATLVNENKAAGNYEVKFNATNLTSGIYFYHISTGSFASTKKMILLK